MSVLVNVLVLCGIYLVELVCYQLGIRILFEVQQKSYVWMTVGIICPVVIGMLPLESTGKNALVSFSVIGAIFLSFEGRRIEKGVELILTFILLECVADVLPDSRYVILNFVDEIFVDHWDYLISNCCVAMEVVLIYLIRKKIHHYAKGRINSAIYFVIGIIAVSMMFCLTALKYAKFYTNNEIFILSCNILSVAINISIFLLIIFVIYIKSTHEKLERLLQTEQLLKESQVNYYKQALKKEEDTRKYRHDMMSHLAYMNDILNKDRVKDAKVYLQTILGGFQKIQSTYYAVGNEMVDIIMNYFFAMLPDNAEIIIKNICPVEFDVEDTEVCTIFSNVFQNAIEEIMGHPTENAEIIIAVQKGKEYVEYNIKNSLSAEIDKRHISKNGLPQSHKSDKKNHGIGMSNVKKTIERNHGKFEWYQENKYFGVSIILPIKRNIESINSLIKNNGNENNLLNKI